MSLNNPIIRVRVGTEPPQPDGHDGVNERVQELREAYIPPIDIHEGPDGLTLEADLPGATEGNLHIQLEDNVLDLYAKIDSPAPEGTGSSTRSIALEIITARSFSATTSIASASRRS